MHQTLQIATGIKCVQQPLTVIVIEHDEIVATDIKETIKETLSDWAGDVSCKIVRNVHDARQAMPCRDDPVVLIVSGCAARADESDIAWLRGQKVVSLGLGGAETDRWRLVDKPFTVASLIGAVQALASDEH